MTNTQISLTVTGTPAQLATVLTALGDAPANPTLPAATTDPKPKKETAAAKKKRLAAEAHEDTLKAAEAEKAADLLGESPVTLDDLKGAVRTFIESRDVSAVKDIFSAFGAEKISEIGSDHYAAVLAKLSA